MENDRDFDADVSIGDPGREGEFRSERGAGGTLMDDRVLDGVYWTMDKGWSDAYYGNTDR